MNYLSTRSRLYQLLIFPLLFITIGGISLIPLPYHIIKPGSAINVSPLISVGEIKPKKSGDFLLTTVSTKRATTFDILLSKVDPQSELIPNQDIYTSGESEEDYQRRQLENMTSSKNSAIIAAFRYAKRPVKVDIKGIEVFNVISSKTTSLKKGDLIQKIDGLPVNNLTSLMGYLNQKNEGTIVKVELIRLKKRITTDVRLVSLTTRKKEKKHVGLGIVPIEKLTVNSNPMVKINSEEIGGPSAGLMFTLEILNRLLPENLTKGYRIAGTGTISPNGDVGQIGGIQYKVIAADKEKIQFFFCPKDMDSQEDNEKIAKGTVKKMGFKIKVIPVQNLDEAVKFLQRYLKGNTVFTVKNIDI